MRILTPVLSRRSPFWAALFFSLVLLGAVPGRAAENNDNQIIAELQQKSLELKRQLLSSDDPLEQERLQKAMMQMVEDALPKLSPQGRALLQIGLKIMQPLQETSSAYLQMVAKFSESSVADFTTVKSREEIPGRIAKIRLLIAANQEILDRIDRVEPDVLKLLDESGVNEMARRGFIDGFTKASARQMGPMKAVRNLDGKLYALFIAGLQHMEANWGHWSVTAAEDIAWDDTAREAKFIEILQEIGTLAARQAEAEQQLLRR
jgi:hypothetical protein